MDPKVLAVIGVIAIVAIAAGGAYFYMSSQHKPQAQQPPPQPPQQQQGGTSQQTGENQGQQQGGEQGGTSQQTGENQGGQGGQTSENQGQSSGQENNQGQQENQAPDLKNLMEKTFTSQYMIEGTITFKSHTSEGDSQGSGPFKMAVKNENTMQYMKFSGTMQGKPFSGEVESIALKQSDGSYQYIMCFKGEQTNGEWMCFKINSQMYEQQSQMTGGNPEKQKAEWEKQMSNFKYEGLKTIKGVTMHCWLAHYVDEQGYDVQQRVCFDAKTYQWRYVWWHSEKGGEYSEGDMFIESFTTNVPDSVFQPPATPQAYPGFGG